MSSSPDFSERAKFSGSKSPEKMNFSRTCNLLSQYLKEKGSFGNLSLEMTCNPQGSGKQDLIPPRTMNLLPMIEAPREESEAKESDHATSSMGFFPPCADFPPLPLKYRPKSSDLSANPRPEATEPKTAPLTIFYGGRVMVFNDFPPDKAQEIMRLCERIASPTPPSTPAPAPSSSPASSPIRDSRNDGFPQNLDFASIPGNRSTDSHLQRPPQAEVSVSDLPIARKASLHRFLEKRKGRITAKAPYQVKTPAPWNGRDERKSWLAL